MVALSEKLYGQGKGPQCGRSRQFAQSEKSPVRCTADVLSARCRRDKCGAIVEAYATDAYGNTLIFTGPGADGVWFTDDDVQSDYGANSIIYCGYRFDPETKNYYVRNRTYNPALGRWLQRDPIGYDGGINLYGYVESAPVTEFDPAGMDCAECLAYDAEGAREVNQAWVNWGMTTPLWQQILEGWHHPLPPIIASLLREYSKQVAWCAQRMDPLAVLYGARQAVAALLGHVPPDGEPQKYTREFAQMNSCAFKYLREKSIVPFGQSLSAHGEAWEAMLPGGQYALKAYVQASGLVELAVVDPTLSLAHIADATAFYLGLDDVNAPIAEKYMRRVVVSKEVSQRLSLENPSAYKAFIAAHPNQISIP